MLCEKSKLQKDRKFKNKQDMTHRVSATSVMFYFQKKD